MEACPAVEICLSICFLASGREAVQVSVGSNCTVRYLKKRLQEAEGTPVAQQRLLVGDAALSNGQLLCEVGLTDGSTVHLVRVHPPPTAVFTVKMVNSAGITILAQDTGLTLEPTEDDVDEYAEWLGMDPDADAELLWIAKEGLMAKVEYPWHVCQNTDGEYFYYNFETRDSSWDHPNDEVQRAKYQRLKAEKECEQKKTCCCGREAEPGRSTWADGEEEVPRVGQPRPAADRVSPGFACRRAASEPRKSLAKAAFAHQLRA